MEETAAYTEVPAPSGSSAGAASEAGEAGTAGTASAASGAAALITGILAMVLIYAVTVLLPKIAAAVDKALDIKRSEVPPAPAGDDNYKVKDIYEGELNLDDNDIKE